MYTEPLFEIAGNKVNLYGVCIAVGILACIFVLYFYTKKKGVPEEVQDYTFFIAIAAIGFGFLAAKFFQNASRNSRLAFFLSSSEFRNFSKCNVKEFP